MRDEWLNQCILLGAAPGDFFSGARKIHRNVTFQLKNLDQDMVIRDCGFTKTKLTMLKRLYYHEESIATAVQLWDRRLGQRKYGSVGFTCYNHFIKNDPTKKSKRASVMGPCIQSVTLTLLPDGSTAVDCFYRTTELFKKFPADLVFLRDTLMPNFKVDKLREVNFHFANVTIHPMYFVTIIPLLDNPFRVLNAMREDERFFNWTVKWTARYLCDEYMRGIAKFAQAMRVRKDALERIPPKLLKQLQDYLRENHPGYRNEYEGDEDE